MKKIKILYISHSALFAGGEICLLTLLKNLDRSFFEPVVIFPTEGPFKKSVENLSIKTYISPLEWRVFTEDGLFFSAVGLEERVQRIVEIIDQEQPDIIHSNTSVVWEGALAARQRGVPHVWHLHEIMQGHPSLTSVLPLTLFYWAVDQLSERVVVVSNAAKKKLDGLVPENKIKVIYNGVELTPDRNPSGCSLRDELGLPHDAILAVTVATLARYKGIDTLLDAAARLKGRNDKLRFLLAGAGSQAAVTALETKIEMLGLTGTFIYLGFRDDIHRILTEVDLLVVSSINESFSLVTAEAMAAGKAVITTDCGGPTELVVNDETGFIVPINNPEALAEKILKLSTDSEVHERLGMNGCKRWAGKFTVMTYADSFQKLYQRTFTEEKQTPLSEKEDLLLKAFVEAYQAYVEKTRTIVSANEQMANLNGLLTEIEKQLAERERQLADRDLQIIDLKEHVGALLGSFSWKVTTPLRSVITLLSRYKR